MISGCMSFYKNARKPTLMSFVCKRGVDLVIIHFCIWDTITFEHARRRRKRQYGVGIAIGKSADIAKDNTLTPARKTDIVVHSCKIRVISAYFPT